MKKPLIKVIKRDAGTVPPPAPSAEEILIQQQLDKVVDDREMAVAVKGWITERRENSRVEAIDAKEDRMAWHAEPTDKPA